jgi:hypothetical protein
METAKDRSRQPAKSSLQATGVVLLTMMGSTAENGPFYWGSIDVCVAQCKKCLCRKGNALMIHPVA